MNKNIFVYSQWYRMVHVMILIGSANDAAVALIAFSLELDNYMCCI